ncbi:MAG: hypothetical protein IKO32_01655 [Lachnospiraceae bacterium]|nr:hypothetical protein [Lachnospiraceae bacterium]
MHNHRNDKEDLLKNAKPVLTSQFILTKSMHRFYAKETFRIYHKKWSNIVMLAGILALGVGILILLSFPSFLKIIGGIFTVSGLYFIFMSRFGYLFGANLSYKNLEEQLGTPPEVRVRFYPAFFSVITGDKTLNFYYKQITKRLEYEELSVLIIGAGTTIAHGQIIDKSAMEPKDLEKYYDLLEHAGVLPE